MKLNEQIVAARKALGYTQEQLAALANVTVRTIQRIESGESVPRSFNLKAIALSLNIPFESLTEATAEVPAVPARPSAATAHFLTLFNLSCFAYLLVPFVHFLVPVLVLRKQRGLGEDAISCCRRIIRQQIFWVVGLQLLMLLTMFYNYLQVAGAGNRSAFIHYLWPCMLMYLANAAVILYNHFRIKNGFKNADYQALSGI